ncbi:MAG: lipocalin family protein [Flavobacteriia bacterium]|nr:lipocalin family protein [Flavobacteriia bacterium]
MKILSLQVLAFSLLIVASSCKKDDDPEPSTPSNREQLSGTWELTDLDANGVISFGGQSIPFVTTNAVIDPGSYFDFDMNPDEVDYDASATVTVSAIQEFDIPYQQAGQGTWELQGRDSLFITEDGRTTRYGILSWNDTRMILRSKQEIDFNGQSFNATIEAVIER